MCSYGSFSPTSAPWLLGSLASFFESCWQFVCSNKSTKRLRLSGKRRRPWQSQSRGRGREGVLDNDDCLGFNLPLASVLSLFHSPSHIWFGDKCVCPAAKAELQGSGTGPLVSIKRQRAKNKLKSPINGPHRYRRTFFVQSQQKLTGH